MTERNLYEITGNVLDINTMLVNRNDLKAILAAEREKCAQLCEDAGSRWVGDQGSAADNLAFSIRQIKE